MKPRPNLLHIVTDQQRFDTIQAAGNPHIFTPHLNWMMDTGTLFTRAYSDAPLCVPARSTMITGMPHYQCPPGYGDWFDPPNADPRRTLPGLLTAAGYQTRAVGKMHYNPARCTHGFEHTEILEDYYRERRRLGGLQPMVHGVGGGEMEPVISMMNESDTLTHWVADRAVNFLETRDPTRPFYMQVGFSKPHPPFDPPLNYWLLYQNKPVPDPILGDWSEKIGDIPPGFINPTYTFSGGDRYSAEQWRDIRRAYYACVTQIDYNLGLILARLRELQLLENTLIVFHSDHGEMLGDHHMTTKTVFFDGSARVPMLVKAPQEMEAFSDLRGGAQCDTLVTLADVMPTFLAAAGVPRPDEMPAASTDLLSICRGHKPQRKFFGAYASHYCQYAVIEDDWKYIYTSDGGGELLFHLARDPQERQNLAAQHPDICRRLHRELAAELGRYGYAGLQAGAQQMPATPARDLRSHRWPGFHSRDHTSEDLLH